MRKFIILSLFTLVTSLAMSQEKKKTSTAEIIANILSNTGGGLQVTPNR